MSLPALPALPAPPALPALTLRSGLIVAWAATSAAVGAGVYRSARRHYPGRNHGNMAIFAGLMWPIVSLGVAGLVPMQCLYALVKPENMKIDPCFF
jgi:hypothetical protein